MVRRRGGQGLHPGRRRGPPPGVLIPGRRSDNRRRDDGVVAHGGISDQAIGEAGKTSRPGATRSTRRAVSPKGKTRSGVYNLPRPAVSRDKRRRVQTRQEPPSLLPGPAQRQVGTHAQEPLEAHRRVEILGRRRHDAHVNPVQAYQQGGCQKTRRGRVARLSRGQSHSRDDRTDGRRARARGTAVLPRVVNRPRCELHRPRRRHLDLGLGRLDLALGLGLGRLALVTATSAKTGPPLGDKVGTGDDGPGPGSHGHKVCTSGTRQGAGCGRPTYGLSLSWVCTLRLALTLENPRPSPDDPPPPHGPPTRGEPVGPEFGTDGSGTRTPPHETRRTPKGRDEAPVGVPPGLARDGPR